MTLPPSGCSPPPSASSISRSAITLATGSAAGSVARGIFASATATAGFGGDLGGVFHPVAPPPSPLGLPPVPASASASALTALGVGVDAAGVAARASASLLAQFTSLNRVFKFSSVSSVMGPENV